jgi:hypothetical protein
MSSSGIPIDSNFKSVSCQLGGLRLNGIVSQGTAQSNVVITIDDSASTNNTPANSSIVRGYLKVNVGGVVYYLPLYQ